MSFEPNGSNVRMHISITPEDREWLDDHPSINASGLFREALNTLRSKIEGNNLPR